MQNYSTFIGFSLLPSIKLHLLLDTQGLLGRKGAEVSHGHEGGGMSQVNLQGPGVAGLPQALDGPGVPKEMGVNSFADPGPLGGFLNDLPGPPAVDLEDAVIQPQLFVEGIAFQAMGQASWAGDQAGLTPFSLDVQGGIALIALYPSRGQAQGLGDA